MSTRFHGDVDAGGLGATLRAALSENLCTSTLLKFTVLEFWKALHTPFC